MPRAAHQLLLAMFPRVCDGTPVISGCIWIPRMQNLSIGLSDGLATLQHETMLVQVNTLAVVQDNNKPIYLYINSAGGSVIAGLSIYDTMQCRTEPS